MKKTLYPLSSVEFNQEIPGINGTLLSESFIITFKNGEFITKENTTLSHLYFIIEGRAKVVTTQTNGKRLILQFLTHGDMIGDLTVIKAEKEIKDVISMGDTICLGIPISKTKESLLTNNDFLRYLSQYIGKKLLLRMEHFKEQQTQEVKVRLAKLLIEIAIHEEYHEKHTEIAEYLGISYRHYMHTIKFFKEEGFIKKVDKQYIIIPSKLKKFITES